MTDAGALGRDANRGGGDTVNNFLISACKGKRTTYFSFLRKMVFYYLLACSNKKTFFKSK